MIQPDIRSSAVRMSPFRRRWPPERWRGRGRVRRVHVLSLLALVLAAAAPVLAGTATPAYASVTFTPSSFYIPLPLPARVNPPEDDPITGPPFYMQAGETRRVSDQLEVSLNADLKSELNNAMFCNGPDGIEVKRASSGT